MDIVIKNGTIVNAGETFRADVGVREGKIVALGTDLSGQENIDATGKYILPGLIEIHAHLESPFGPTRSIDNFFWGTQAAASSGVTTLIDRVQAAPNESLLEALQNRKDLADPQVAIDYSLHVSLNGLNENLLDELPQLIDAGCPSFEAHMVHRDPRQALGDADLIRLLQMLGDSNGMLLLHCGNQALLEHLRQRYPLEENAEAIPNYPKLWPTEAEAAAVLKVISLARHFDTPIFLHNLSTAAAVNVLSHHQHLVPKVNAGCGLHHLTHTEEEYNKPQGRNFTCIPPLRSPADQDALWAGLTSGLLQAVASNHQAFTREQKKLGKELLDIPAGFANLGALLPVMYHKGVGGKHLNLMRMVGLLSTWPAQIFGLPEKGSIAVGKDADMVLFDPMEKRSLSASLMHSQSDFSPYEGLEVQGLVEMTFSRGKIVYDSGKFVGEQGGGQFVPRRL